MYWRHRCLLSSGTGTVPVPALSTNDRPGIDRSPKFRRRRAPGTDSLPSPGVEILSALFIDNVDLRPAEGGASRIDLTGVQFSAAAPSPLPLTWAPHLSVIIRCAPDEAGTGVLEVVYERDGEQIARNVQPLQVEPGKFNYRLVRGEIDFEDYGTVEAHCRVDQGPVLAVPYTLLAPPGS